MRVSARERERCEGNASIHPTFHGRHVTSPAITLSQASKKSKLSLFMFVIIEFSRRGVPFILAATTTTAQDVARQRGILSGAKIAIFVLFPFQDERRSRTCLLTAKTRFWPRSAESKVGSYIHSLFLRGKNDGREGGRKFPPTSETPSDPPRRAVSSSCIAARGERYILLTGHASPRHYAVRLHINQ